MKTILAYLISGAKQVGVQMIGIIIACISLAVGLMFSLEIGVITLVVLFGVLSKLSVKSPCLKCVTLVVGWFYKEMCLLCRVFPVIRHNLLIYKNALSLVTGSGVAATAKSQCDRYVGSISYRSSVL